MVTKSVTQQLNDGRSSLPARNHSSRFDMWLLRRLHSSLGDPQIGITLRDSLQVSPQGTSPIATFVIQDRGTLLQMLFDPQLGFGDAYTAGRVTVDGNLIAALETVFRSMSAIESCSWYSRSVSPILAFLQRNSLQGARKNIHCHYDLDAKFFRLWLDSQLVYSGAYFPSPSLALEEAQIAKMDYICRKLNLQPGELHRPQSQPQPSPFIATQTDGTKSAERSSTSTVALGSPVSPSGSAPDRRLRYLN
jgi:cyclopropane-fatty-acyl-phospholipid synthase